MHELMKCSSSIDPRPSPSSPHIYICMTFELCSKGEGEGLEDFHHVICGTNVTLRHSYISIMCIAYGCDVFRAKHRMMKKLFNFAHCLKAYKVWGRRPEI